MQGQNKIVLMLARLDQTGTQQWATLKIKRFMSLRISECLQALLASAVIQRGKILPLHAQIQVRLDLLPSHTIDTRESGAQGFVAVDQGVQRRFETTDIQHPAQPRHAADVVGRAVRLQLPEEPHTLLGIGQRHVLVTVDTLNRQLAIAVTGQLNQAHLLSKRSQFAGVEQHTQRQLDIAYLTGTGNNLGRQQRMPAKGKEVVVQTNTLQAQHFAPYRSDLLFQLSTWGYMFALLPLRIGQRPAIQFAARAQGHAVQTHQLRRHHVFRQLNRECSFQLFD